MRNNDLVVVGGGLSGLFAACVAAKAGKKVKVLAYGESTLAVASGVIDVLGYADDGEYVKNPIEGMKSLTKEHPYAKVDEETVEEALKTFLHITNECGYPYIGDIHKNRWIPTAIGKFKPTCLTPKSMNTEVLFKCKHILVVGFEGMKDFYADLVTKNLKEQFANEKSISAINVKTDLETEKDLRDISALDIARWISDESGYNSFKTQVAKAVTEDTVVILPAVLGLEPDYSILDGLEKSLKTTFIEVFSLPPAITGLRLHKLLMAYAKKHGVQIIKKANVVSAEVEDGICKAVVVEGVDRKRKIYADKFILATGGAYGGGLIAGIGTMKEPIFDIDIEVPSVQTEWSSKQLFTKGKQLFATFGVKVDEDLTPITKDGKKIASNVKFVGRSLAGYDFCYEKSGNGVAIITAYKAAKDFCKVV